MSIITYRVHSIEQGETALAAAGRRVVDLVNTADGTLISERLGRMAVDTAEIEGQLVALHAIEGRTVKDARVALMERLIQGADDTWSGRGNDVKRAFFDGVREIASGLAYLDDNRVIEGGLR